MADAARVEVPALAGTAAAPKLKRALRLKDLTAFYVGTVLSVRWTAMAAAAGPSSLVVWIFAVLCFFIPLAGSVMELSSRYPREGGCMCGRGSRSGILRDS